MIHPALEYAHVVQERDGLREENARLRRLLEEVLANYDPTSGEMWSLTMWLEDVTNEIEDR